MKDQINVSDSCQYRVKWTEWRVFQGMSYPQQCETTHSTYKEAEQKWYEVKAKGSGLITKPVISEIK